MFHYPIPKQHPVNCDSLWFDLVNSLSSLFPKTKQNRTFQVNSFRIKEACLVVHTSNHGIQEAKERTAMRLRPIMPYCELQELGIYRKISFNQQIRTKCFRGSKWRVLFLFKRCIYVSECLTPYMYVYQMQPCTCRGQRRVRRSDNLWNWRLHVGVGNQTQVLGKNKCAYLLSHFPSPRTTVKHSPGKSGNSSVSKEAYW